MSKVKLTALPRNTAGRLQAIKLRNEGFIPGVMYGTNKETQSIKINGRDLKRYLSSHGQSGATSIELDGQIVPVIIKEVQRDIIKEDILHIDLQQLSDDQKIRIQVPVILTGKEKIDNSSVIEQQLIELDVQCLPKHIPQSITVDISDLDVGEYVTIGDLAIASDENVEVLGELSQIVASLAAATRDVEPEETIAPIYESTRSILDKK